MFMNEWVEVSYLSHAGQVATTNQAIGKVVSLGSSSMWVKQTDCTKRNIQSDLVTNIRLIKDEDLVMEYQTDLSRNAAGHAIDELAKLVIVTFDNILDDLPDDYENLFEQLQASVTAIQLKGSPADGNGRLG